MRILLISTLLTFTISIFANRPVDVVLKDGKTIHASGYGQLDCDGNKYFDHQFLIKGKYNDIISEISDFSKIEKIEFLDFEEPPVNSGSNEKGMITVFKKNGITFTLNDASISLACYGVSDKYNQLVFHLMSPVTERTSESFVETKDIKFIIFK